MQPLISYSTSLYLNDLFPLSVALFAVLSPYTLTNKTAPKPTIVLLVVFDVYKFLYKLLDS
jgi:hypothetical protein